MTTKQQQKTKAVTIDLFDPGNGYDVILKLSPSQKLYAHKNVLISQSDYFSKMFSSGMIEQNQLEINLYDEDEEEPEIVPEIEGCEENVSPTTAEPNSNSNALLAFIEYLYTQRIEITKENAVELLVVSNKFAASLNSFIVSRCQHVIGNNLTVENALDVIHIFVLYSNVHFPILEEYLTKFMFKNYAAVYKITKATKICASKKHFLMVTDDKRLLCMGSNTFGELTLDKETVKKIQFPLELANVPNAINASCGEGFSFILTDTSLLFCGHSHGQLKNHGLQTLVSPMYQVPIHSIPFGLKDIADISSGAEHTLVLTKQGTVYGTGSNNRGQLSTNDDTKAKQGFTKAKGLEGVHVDTISCDSFSSGCVTGLNQQGEQRAFVCGLIHEELKTIVSLFTLLQLTSSYQEK